MFTLSLSAVLICTGAALLGGFIDAIAGGGGLITMPALLLTGVPPHLALGTNKISACAGTAVIWCSGVLPWPVWLFPCWGLTRAPCWRCM